MCQVLRFSFTDMVKISINSRIVEKVLTSKNKLTSVVKHQFVMIANKMRGRYPDSSRFRYKASLEIKNSLVGSG